MTKTVWTMSIPAAGRKYFDMGRDASYEAARTGVIPTVKVGRKKKRALVRILEQRLESSGEQSG